MKEYWHSLLDAAKAPKKLEPADITDAHLRVLAGSVGAAAPSAAPAGGGLFGALASGVGDLFAGALIPGLLLSSLYILFMIVVALIRPSACPPLKSAEPGAKGEGAKLATA